MPLRFRKKLFSMLLVVFLVTGTLGSARAGSPWEFLNGFKLLPDSIVQIDEHYIAALLHEPDRRLFAVVVFSANCGSVGCQVRNAAGFSVFDTQGVKVLEYIDPEEGDLIQLISGGSLV